MSSINFVLISLFIAIFSLVLVSIANQRQTRSRLISRKLSQLKRRVTDLEELSVSIEPLLESAGVPRIINEEIVDLIKGMNQLEPSSQLTEVTLHAALERRKLLNDPANKAEMYRIQESDAELAKCTFFLTECGRIVRKRQAQGLLEIAEMENFIHELAWAHLMVSITTHVAQGHKAYKRGDVMRALAFYKKAQQVAMESTMPDERRHDLIRELADMLANKRKALSPALMPETQYNPTAETINNAARPSERAPGNT